MGMFLLQPLHYYFPQNSNPKKQYEFSDYNPKKYHIFLD